MTVNEFIKILQLAKDIDIAPIEFWIGEKEYELERVGQFGALANVTVSFAEVSKPILRPAVLQRHMRKKANAIIKKIRKKENETGRRSRKNRK